MGLDYFFSSNLSKTTIIAVSISNPVVTIDVARRAIAIISITAETRAKKCDRYFNQPSPFRRIGPDADLDGGRLDFIAPRRYDGASIPSPGAAAPAVALCPPACSLLFACGFIKT